MVRLSLLRFAKTVVEEASAKVATDEFARFPPLPSVREILKLYKIKALRNLSQNFLLDARLNNKIVTETGKVRDCYVCEVGPGPGNITRCILRNGAKHVIVVEKDRRFVPSLELLADACEGRMKIIIGDIMDLSLENIYPRNLAHDWKLPSPPLYIIGNLPFNISTPLIVRWMRHCSTHTGPFIHGRTQLTLTFQKEVGLRMAANPGRNYRSRLSIMCQYLCHVENLFTISGKAFFPRPEVDVAVVKFTPRIRPLIDQPFEIVDKIVFTIFHHRQKYIRYGIQNLFPESRPDLAKELIARSKVNEKSRSFELEIEEFKALCDCYVQICEENKGIVMYNYQIHKRKKSFLDEVADFVEKENEEKDLT